jgi:muramidase (phage lysozyme)
MTNLAPLRDYIAKYESRGDYNIVWGGIATRHRPPKPLVKMRIGEVLAWQDSIDAMYMSEASGKYQIMEDTLRGLYKSAGLSTQDLFNEASQDKLADALLVRRGLDRYLNGEINAHSFANKLAREWASLPVVTGANRGKSYYAGDGLNKAHASVDGIMAAIDAIKKAPASKPTPAAPQLTGWAAFFALFRGWS